jgi:hypothetical protein
VAASNVHAAPADVHAAANVHATSTMWRAAEVAASAADVRCSAVTSAASLRRRGVGAAGQNHHQTESDQRAELCAELCHGKLTGCASAPKRAAPQIPKTDNPRARPEFQMLAVPDA